MLPPSVHAAALLEAWNTKTPIQPFTDTSPGMTESDAYAVQERYVELLLQRDGGHVVGYKLGLTSKPMQEMFGVDQPDYGPLLSSMVFADGATIHLTDYIQPRIEAEIALVLGRELSGPHVTIRDAADAVTGAVAAIEMVDSRFADWRIKLADSISDLASSAATIRGRDVVPINGWDPRLCGMVITKNGVTMDTGAGAAALGNPIGALAWLANSLTASDHRLQPGWLIMTGSLHRAFPIATGDVVVAEFDRLGAVSASFE